MTDSHLVLEDFTALITRKREYDAQVFRLDSIRQYDSEESFHLFVNHAQTIALSSARICDTKLRFILERN